MTVSEIDPRVDRFEPGVSGAARDLWRRLRQGELGSIPVVLGLIAVWIYFQSANSNFLSSGNLTNLMLQIASFGTISVGVVLVLLLGEIDLSVGYVSGLAAATMAVLNVKSDWPAVWAIVAGLAVGAGIGLLQGLWVTKLRVPSFVVTLAGFLAWQGALLHVLGSTGSINVTDETITDLAGTFYSDAIGWALAAIAIGLTVLGVVRRRRRSQAAGLVGVPLREDLQKRAASQAAHVRNTLFAEGRGRVIPHVCLTRARIGHDGRNALPRDPRAMLLELAYLPVVLATYLSGERGEGYTENEIGRMALVLQKVYGAKPHDPTPKETEVWPR